MSAQPSDKPSFDHIWEKVISPVSVTVLGDVDPEFKESCALRIRPDGEWKNALYSAYQHFRGQLKDICYGPSDHRSPEELLDGRKIAAVLCASVLDQKGFDFDMVKARGLLEEKKRELERSLDALEAPVAFNNWAVENIYVN